MPALTITQAKKILNEIGPKDSVAIIHHDDGDGFCSGILFKDHCESLGAKTKTFTYSHSKTKISKLPLKRFNKIIITDISAKGNYGELSAIKHKTIFFCDHHPKFPTPEEILTLLTADQGYIPSSRTAYELVGGKSWLSLIGVISDTGDLYKENSSFIKKILNELNLQLEDFKTSYSHIFSDTIVYFEKTPEKTFKKLSKISSLEEISSLKKYSKSVEAEIEKYVKDYKKKKEKIGNVNLYFFEPKFKIKGIVTSILGRENPEEAIICISRKESNKNLLGISARCQRQDANLPELLEAATKNLTNSNFGGHPRSSGGQIQTKDLEKFKQNIKNYISKSNS